MNEFNLKKLQNGSDIRGISLTGVGGSGVPNPSSVDSTMKVPTHNLPSYPQTLENTGVCPYFFVAKFFLL